jgi:hypothetical protein
MSTTCICKKDYQIIDSYYNLDVYFKKDQTYEYLKYYSNINDKNYKNYMIFKDGIRQPISLDKKVFNQYFIDLQKLRKLKLQKLKNYN